MKSAQCFRHGAAAQRAGRSVLTNPYIGGKAADWLEGYRRAAQGEPIPDPDAPVRMWNPDRAGRHRRMVMQARGAPNA